MLFDNDKTLNTTVLTVLTSCLQPPSICLSACLFLFCELLIEEQTILELWVVVCWSTFRNQSWGKAKLTVTEWTVSPTNSYAEIITHSASEYDLIWKPGHCRLLIQRDSLPYKNKVMCIKAPRKDRWTQEKNSVTLSSCLEVAQLTIACNCNNQAGCTLQGLL